LGLQAFDMTGKVAVVTGAAGLLGAKHCEALAEAGAHVVCLDIKLEDAQELAHQLTHRFGPRCLGVGCDIVQTEQVKSAALTVLGEFGRVDALVNNARSGYATEELVGFEDFDVRVIRRDFMVQVEGAVICAQHFGAQMAKQGNGSIVNICSTYGVVAPDLRIYQEEQVKFGTPVSYSVAKSALIGLTKYLASYWGVQNVRVNLLTPGGIRAEGRRQSDTFLNAYSYRVPLGRMARENEMQGAIVFLCSDASSYMTGANLVVDGGWTAW
jgi:NAD(P)-dependent dehydrogenase (short-subunit alcohol dehydrogenase family)